MSRVANNPIHLPNGVEANIQGNCVIIKGPKGEFKHEAHRFVKVIKEGTVLRFSGVSEETSLGSGSKNLVIGSISALAGTTRAIVNNYVTGVSQGFERKLTMVGVGYRAQMKGHSLEISAGFSHPVLFDVPKGITIETPTQTEIFIKGADKQQVGQVAANIRRIRPPEPYKGKGIRYADEKISLKETKKK